jgi:hypothetical protein
MMAQRGTEDTAGPAPVSGRELASAGQDVTDLLPLDQVPAVEDGCPGEILETRCGQVKVIPDAADGGVGKETRDDGRQRARIEASTACVAVSHVSFSAIRRGLWLLAGRELSRYLPPQDGKVRGSNDRKDEICP